MRSRFRTLVGLFVLAALSLPACAPTMYTEEDLHRIDREQGETEREAIESARGTEELGGESVEGEDEAMGDAVMDIDR